MLITSKNSPVYYTANVKIEAEYKKTVGGMFDIFEYSDSDEETPLINDDGILDALPIDRQATQPLKITDNICSYLPTVDAYVKTQVAHGLNEISTVSTQPFDLTSVLSQSLDDEFSQPFNTTQEELACLAHINLADENLYHFHGCPVIFPYKAYRSQMQMMEKLIKGAQRSQNCLLESPTGTGKTAALVCALLAWQQQFEQIQEEKFCQFQEDQWQREEIFNLTQQKEKPDEDSPSKNPKVEEITSTFDVKEEIWFPEEPIPIIYYATRTHSQIKQVIKQLSQTKYKDIPMSILASRKQTCINPEAIKSESVEKTCKKFRYNYHHLPKNEKKNGNSAQTIMEQRICPFYKGPLKESSFKRGYETTWDIEDMKAHGEQCGSCPYQEMPPLQAQARIIFCTYNHLLNKHIREALKIKLEGNILVFDEAHNIEDVCCEIASLFGSEALTLSTVTNIVFNFVKSTKYKPAPPSKAQALANLTMAFRRLQNWLEDQLKIDASDFVYVPDGSSPTLKKYKRPFLDNFVEEMSKIQFGSHQIRKLWSDYFVLEDQHHTIKPLEGDAPFRVDPDTMKSISSILFCLKLLFKLHPVTQELCYYHDFDKFLLKRVRTVPEARIALGLVSSQSGKEGEDVEFHLLCLNPAIVFEKMKSARTVIVTSGTLSPTNSFSTELDAIFKHEHSANHVLGPDRLFSCIINSNSRTDKRLRFTASSLQSDSTYKDHQDQVFKIILRLCKRIPFGILVFVPSSTFISKLKSEWHRNGNLQRLRSEKELYFEHEHRRADDFNQMMESFREKVEDPSGAIIFAVLRGKISEGVDFNDNQARAVITIGIPFAPCKSDGIMAKQADNNKKRIQNEKYLSGGEWYNAQAFRALNQAFGRCVRHVVDWGSIFIVESRFTDFPRYRGYLSEWVQDSMMVPGRVTNASLDDVLPHLERFVQNLI